MEMSQVNPAPARIDEWKTRWSFKNWVRLRTSRSWNRLRKLQQEPNAANVDRGYINIVVGGDSSEKKKAVVGAKRLSQVSILNSTVVHQNGVVCPQRLGKHICPFSPLS